MQIQACLNGARQAADHSALPLTPQQLATAARTSVEAGARSLHIHPRDAGGRQSLEGRDIAAAVIAVRRACPGVPIGVSTLFAIVPEPVERVERVERWGELPDFASVNFSEPRTVELCHALWSKGVWIEAGLATARDAERFVREGGSQRCVRVLLEPEEPTPAAALATTAAIEAVLDHAGIRLPRLLHGFNTTAWPLFDAAARGGYEARVGLEDMLSLPNAQEAPDNAAIVRAAFERASHWRS